MALGVVPMCSYQMERMFNTTRIPGKEAGGRHWRRETPLQVDIPPGGRIALGL